VFNEPALLQVCALMGNPNYRRMSSGEAARMAAVYLGHALWWHNTSGAHYERACFVFSALPSMLERAEPLLELTRLGCLTEPATVEHRERGVRIPQYSLVIAAFESYLRRANYDGTVL
jgi:hypothetical protein